MKQAGTKEKKKDQQKQKGGQGERSNEEPSLEGAVASCTLEVQSNMEVGLNRTEMLELLAKLESVIKTEIMSVRTDMGQLLQRVEEVEEIAVKQVKEILDLQEQISKMQIENRMMAYKIEEQENQSRRQNLRIRSIPEQLNEDLGDKMRKIFNPVLGRREEELLRIDRVHRVRKPPDLN